MPRDVHVTKKVHAHTQVVAHYKEVRARTKTDLGSCTLQRGMCMYQNRPWYVHIPKQANGHYVMHVSPPPRIFGQN